MVEYLTLKMPSGRIVNGPFFDKLAAVKLAPRDLMPRVMQAMLTSSSSSKLQTTHSDSHTRRRVRGSLSLGAADESSLGMARWYIFGIVFGLGLLGL